MQEYLSADEAALLLRNARMGGIVTPDQLRSELRHVKQRPAIGRYAVGASVPDWLVERLDPTERLRHTTTRSIRRLTAWTPCCSQPCSARM